jgi:hypothetical protein
MTAPKQASQKRNRAKQQGGGTETPPAISREEYADFIGQIELMDLWLHEASVVNSYGPQTPDQANFRFALDAKWEIQDSGFRIFHHYVVLIEAVDSPLAELNVTFGVDFSSTISLTDDIFAIFAEVNLPVNTWPFLREFVSTTMGRMGWIPFTIPALKQGVRRAKRPTQATRTRGAQARRPRQTPE